MKKKLLFSSLVALVMFSACDKNDDDELNDTDRNFVNMASMSNNAEVMAGQLASTKGSNAAVKMYGQMMVSDHTTAQTELQNLAGTVGLTASTQVDAEHQALMARLNSLSGYSFDTAYINSQVRDHQKAISLFQDESNNGQRTEVKNYANKYLPALQMHYQRADSIRQVLH
jgi:putative membrane protein